MKLISPIKSLTAVGFLLVTAFHINASADTQEECISRKKRELFAACEKGLTEENNSEGVKLKNCQITATEKANLDDTCLALPTKSEISIKESKCESAMDKYNTAAKDAAGACESFEKVPGTKNTCEERIKSCRKKINNGTSGSAGAGTDDLMKSMMSIYVQQNYPNANSNDFPVDGGTTGPSCTNYKSKEDRKEKKNDLKDLDKEISKLKEKINDEKKKITEENAKLREKNAEIDTDLQKVDEAVKKAIRTVDEKKGEQLRKLNEDLAKSAIAIRKKNEEIIQEKEKVERIKFENAQKMMQFTQDKISTQCQSAIDTAKQCFIMSSKGQTSNDPKNPCAGFTITAKGAKGTAQLKAKVAKVKEACFEQANMAVNKSKFDLATTLRASEMALLNKNNEITDAKNDIERRQNDNTSISAESEKEKTDEQKNAEKQIENLTNKLERITKSTQEAITHSNEKMQEFANEINELNTKKLAAKMGVLESEEMDNSLSDAESVISGRESARKNALNVCCVEEKVDPDKSYTAAEIKNMKPNCQQLARGGTNQKDEKGRSATKGTEK